VTKLTLSVDPSVVEAAKRYAAASGTSVSRLVENYLTAITSPTEVAGPPPMLARWRGALANIDLEDYREHLIGKYGK
jgi:hypothetical protein